MGPFVYWLCITLTAVLLCEGSALETPSLSNAGAKKASRVMSNKEDPLLDNKKQPSVLSQFTRKSHLGAQPFKEETNTGKLLPQTKTHQNPNQEIPTQNPPQVITLRLSGACTSQVLEGVDGDINTDFEHVLEPGTPLVITHRITVAPSCSCTEIDVSALNQRITALESQISELRQQCGGGGGCCHAATGSPVASLACGIHGTLQLASCRCDCEPGWGGPQCNEKHCPDNCSDQGRCVHDHCECFPGFSGPSCSQPACPSNCSGNGSCHDGKCICENGFSGDDCSIEPCPNKCQKRGKCVNGKCVCEAGYTGKDCSVVLCPSNCRNRGQCVNGKCVCDAGFAGEDCSTPLCQNNCRNRGQCLNGKCVCDAGFTGEDCSIPICQNNCRNKGQCLNGKCVCDAGFTGEDCSTPLCPNNCRKRGHCVAGKCVCDAGFTGEECSLLQCPNNCSNKGRCVKGRCVCQRGFTGLSCEESSCPGNCNNKGHCVRGQCICNPGFKGPNCMIATCLIDCGEHGQCKEGLCVCQEGFWGDNCALVLPSIDGLHTKNVTDTSVVVSWNQPQEQVEGYEITFQTTKDDKENLTIHLRGEDTSYVQQGLAPGQEYKIYVRTQKNQTLGPTASAFFQTYLSGPLNLRVIKIKSNLLIIRWEHQASVIDRYWLSFTPLDGGKPTRTRELPPERNVAQITGLEAGRHYIITLEAEVGNKRSLPVKIQATTGSSIDTGLFQNGITVDTNKTQMKIPDDWKERDTKSMKNISVSDVKPTTTTKEKLTNISILNKEEGKDNKTIPTKLPLRPKTKPKDSKFTVHTSKGKDNKVIPTNLPVPPKTKPKDDKFIVHTSKGSPPKKPHRPTIFPVKSVSLETRSKQPITVTPRPTSYRSLAVTDKSLNWKDPMTHYETESEAVRIPEDNSFSVSTVKTVYVKSQKHASSSSGNIGRPQYQTTTFKPSGETFKAITSAPGLQLSQSGTKRVTGSMMENENSIKVNQLPAPPTKLTTEQGEQSQDTNSTKSDKASVPTTRELSTDDLGKVPLVPPEVPSTAPSIKYKSQKTLVKIHTDNLSTKAPTIKSDRSPTKTKTGIKSQPIKTFQIDPHASSGFNTSVVTKLPNVVKSDITKKFKVTSDGKRVLINGTISKKSLTTPSQKNISVALPKYMTGPPKGKLPSHKQPEVKQKLKPSTPQRNNTMLDTKTVSPYVAIDGQPSSTTTSPAHITDRSHQAHNKSREKIKVNRTPLKVQGTETKSSQSIASSQNKINGTPVMTQTVITEKPKSSSVIHGIGLNKNNFLITHHPRLYKTVTETMKTESKPVDFHTSAIPTYGLKANEIKTKKLPKSDIYKISRLTTQTTHLEPTPSPTAPYSVNGSHVGSMPNYNNAARPADDKKKADLHDKNEKPQVEATEPRSTTYKFKEKLDNSSQNGTKTVEGVVHRNESVRKPPHRTGPNFGAPGRQNGTIIVNLPDKDGEQKPTTGSASESLLVAEENGPSNVQVSNITPDSMELSWVAKEGAFRNFLIIYKEYGAKNVPVQKVVPGRARSFRIRGLKPNTRYFLSISGTINGVRSKMERVMSKTASGLVNPTPVPPTRTAHVEEEGTPLARVEMMRVISQSPRSLTISWSAPMGVFSAFLLSQRSQMDKTFKQKKLNPNIRSFQLNDLNPDTVYEIRLQGIANGRVSPALMTTSRTAPDTPREIFFSDVKNTSVVVRWVFLEDNVDSYKVTYTNLEEGEPYSVQVEGSQVTLTNLVPGSKYEISVMSVQGREESDPVTGIVLTAPDTPSSFKAINVTTTMALLIWKPVSRTVDRYIIVLRSQDSPEMNLSTAGNITELPLKNLKSGTTYAVHLSSEKGGVQSAPVGTVFNTSVVGPEDLMAKEVSPRTALLTWKAPMSTITGYILIFRSDDGESKEVMLNPNEIHYKLSGLIPSTKYNVSLTGLRGKEKTSTVSTSFTTGNLRFPYPLDCSQEMMNGLVDSGQATIYPGGKHSPPVQVYCDMMTAGGGWTVFQRRKNGKTNFYRSWNEYKNGFGNISDEFWLGNDNIHKLTTQSPQMLRVDLRTKHEHAFAVYRTFNVDKEQREFRLTISGYSGTAGDSLLYHNGQPFSTKDRDLKKLVTRCAVSYKGGWWYKNCHEANLNGIYGNNNNQQGINWLHWKGQNFSIPFTEMKLRPLYFDPTRNI
ncbi:tenascin-like isoform X1 [Erpetoichthys calabaricus]|uniref:tenascin-like isoform X1 n=1 Tax=Erpetoichthys calabaricus TaxID=27687 RepID=UPI002234A0C4|nr:tenascin-like isoform X1 [Erpetoichthys calabaricus]